MSSAQPLIIAAGVVFGLFVAVATYFIGRETAPQRALYHDPNAGRFRDSDPTCSICREDILITTGTSLKCGHVFHTACIQKWNKIELKCPNCNVGI